MLRVLFILLTVFGLMLASALNAQDAEQAAEDAGDESATEESSAPILGSDDADLDLQSYEDDEDDFIPTEEVPADQAIPFPSDI